MTTPYRKKLIEVALPLDAINREAAKAKRKAPAGYPTTLHKWWAQRPIAACRAVLFASLVDDPSSRPDLWPTIDAQEKKRQELFRLIEELVKWENSNDQRVLKAAREEILRSTDGNPPAVYDPFCGGGSIPLEAQRLGLQAHASDLNPVPVLITKALIEIPPKFIGRPPVNPEARRANVLGSPAGTGRRTKKQTVTDDGRRGASGLAEDIRYYGRWVRDQAEQRLGKLYPKVFAMRAPDGTHRYATAEEKAAKKADELTVIAWLWARTVASPNPAAKGAHVPLVQSFWLTSKTGKKTWMEPVVDRSSMTYTFRVCVGSPDEATVRVGTKTGRGANFRCILTGVPIAGDYIKAEGLGRRLGARLMAIVADGSNGRVFLPPSDEHEHVVDDAHPQNVPDEQLAHDPRNIWCIPYGVTRIQDLFTARQLVAATTFVELIDQAYQQATSDADGDSAYGGAVATYLACAMSRCLDYGNTLCSWRPKDNAMRSGLSKQAIPMVWDYAEGSPFGASSSGFLECVNVIARCLDFLPVALKEGKASQRDATTPISGTFLYCTDPPYYDNISYADLSDFFYVWHRRALQKVHPDLFKTIVVPKKPELIATPERHNGSRIDAKRFFEKGLESAFAVMRDSADEKFPMTVFYAFRQSEGESDEAGEASDSANENQGRASTGWETMLSALIGAGFFIDGTWPVRTEGDNRQVGINANALASSIVLVCRPRPRSAGVASRRDFLAALRRELPEAVRHLQKGNIAPVDLAQAAIGPGMAVFSRYSRVLENDGAAMGVRTALALINGTLDEVLAEQEGEFDSETRWALAWFDQYGFTDGPFGVAETLSTAKNTAVAAMAEAGILIAKGGKVRLLRTDELTPGWDPNTDKRFTIWEATHHLVRALETRGEEGAADLTSRLGGARAELARDLSYRLYTLCERRKWAKDALQYNSLVQAWPEATRIAASKPAVETFTQKEML